MKIFISHSSHFDFQNELYKPLKESPLSQSNEFIFPHETTEFSKTKQIIQTADLILAEVSYPSTGQGIELGWANDSNKSIICFYKETAHPSYSLQVIAHDIVSYTNLKDLIEKITQSINKE